MRIIKKKKLKRGNKYMKLKNELEEERVNNQLQKYQH